MEAAEISEPEFFLLLINSGIESKESISCENQFRCGIDFWEGEGGPENEVDYSFKINISWDMADSVPYLVPTQFQDRLFLP